MIGFMQKHRKYFVVTLWISVTAFIISGMGMMAFSSKQSNVIAKVGEKEITGQQLQSSYNRVFGYYNQLFGGKLTQEKAQQMNLEAVAMQNLEQEALLLNYADELGITALKDELISEYVGIDAFKKDGVFDKDRVKQVLQSMGTNKKEFEADLKKSIILKKLDKALELPATTLEEKTIFSAQNIKDKLLIKVVEIDQTDLDVNESQVKSFWENSKYNYMSKKSYVLDIIKEPIGDINVTDEEIQTFYDEKKHMFKDQDGKIVAFEKAKDLVTAQVKFKKAKAKILRKYLDFKKGKIKAKESITIKEGDDFPMQKIRKASKGDFIKTIQLKDSYLTAQIREINNPSELSFEDAKILAKVDLIKQTKMQKLEEKVKKESKKLTNGKKIDYISQKDVDKLDFLSTMEATQFLKHLFSKSEKNGYFILQDKAIAYEIQSQKLFDKDEFEKAKEQLAETITNIKQNAVRSGLLDQLAKKYRVERYNKG